MSEAQPKPPHPATPFKYKPRPKLEPGEAMLDQMANLGMLNVSHIEAAAVLGCSRTTLELFWEANPEYREAYDNGKLLRKARLRKIVDMHSISDAGTARFLAKNELGMSDDPSKARADEAAAAEAHGRMNREQANKAILELQRKLGAKVIEHDPGEVYREPGKDQPKQGRSERKDAALGKAANQGAGAQRGQQEGLAQPQADAAGEPGVDGGVPEAPGPRTPRQADPDAHDAPPQGPGLHAKAAGAPVDQPTPGGVSAVARLEARLADLEASAVRKNPRKDGAAHTDRTKAVDAPTNRPQVRGATHVPGRLPGRLGKL